MFRCEIFRSKLFATETQNIQEELSFDRTLSRFSSLALLCRGAHLLKGEVKLYRGRFGTYFRMLVIQFCRYKLLIWQNRNSPTGLLPHVVSKIVLLFQSHLSNNSLLRDKQFSLSGVDVVAVGDRHDGDSATTIGCDGLIRLFAV